MKKLLLVSLIFTFKNDFVQSQPSVAQYRHDYSGSTNPAEMYGPQKIKSDYKPLPWKDKFPRYNVNVTEVLDLHRMTEKDPVFEPILTKKRETGTVARVPELLRPIQVRCPKGWSPWGPMCLAEVSLGPRTECFGDLGRFISSLSGVSPKQTSLFPGICQEKREVGPSLTCSPGMKLRLKYESETNAKTGEVTPNVISWACEGYKIIPYSELDGGLCPAGYIMSIEGCKAFQILPPIAICPENSQPSYSGNNFALYEKSAMVCEITKYTKGRIWCPKGFNIISPSKILDKYEFGEEIPEDITYEVISGSYDEDNKQNGIFESFFSTMNGLSNKTDAEFPLSTNKTKLKGSNSISGNLFTTSSHFIKESQANIQLAQMQGMSIESDYPNINITDISNIDNLKEDEIFKNKSSYNKSNSNFDTLEFSNRKWEGVQMNNNINLRKLQGLAPGGSIETQMFEPGLNKELEYGPLSGLVMGNYGDVYGKETEEEMLITSRLGQIMGNDQRTTPPLLQTTQKKTVSLKETACSLIVSAHSSDCTPLQCKNSFLKELNHILRDWAVFVLQADPDSGSNLIPNGKDIPFTNTG